MYASLSLIGALGVSRLVLRSNAGAWGAFVVLLLLLVVPYDIAIAPAMPVVLAAGVGIARSALLLAVLVRSGLLGWVVAWMTELVVAWGVPWTLDPSRWFFWRGAVVFVVLVAVAFWGFKHALGKQSMFSGEAFDG